MARIKLLPGDVVCTANPMWLGKAINFVQKVNSKDNESTYSHALIILHDGKVDTVMPLARIKQHEKRYIDVNDAVTFEALWTNKCQKFLDAYVGKQVLIGRHEDMTIEKALNGWRGVAHHKGKLYAGHRLLFFFIPFVAKYFNLGLGVCSELVMKFLCCAGVEENWKGWNPDDVADMIKKHKKWKVVYEGVL